MAAGSISNMFDRLVRGHVVDYVGFRLEDKHLEGITYNFADFFIAAGAVITVMTKLFRPGFPSLNIQKRLDKGKSAVIFFGDIFACKLLQEPAKHKKRQLCHIC